jgi:hypothetical protein
MPFTLQQGERAYTFYNRCVYTVLSLFGIHFTFNHGQFGEVKKREKSGLKRECGVGSN